MHSLSLTLCKSSETHQKTTQFFYLYTLNLICSFFSVKLFVYLYFYVFMVTLKVLNFAGIKFYDFWSKSKNLVP